MAPGFVCEGLGGVDGLQRARGEVHRTQHTRERLGRWRMRARRNGEDRTDRPPQHLFGDGPEHKMLKSGRAVGAHHNEVRGQRRRMSENRIHRTSGRHDHIEPDAGLAHRSQRRGDVRFERTQLGGGGALHGHGILRGQADHTRDDGVHVKRRHARAVAAGEHDRVFHGMRAGLGEVDWAEDASNRHTTMLIPWTRNASPNSRARPDITTPEAAGSAF